MPSVRSRAAASPATSAFGRRSIGDVGGFQDIDAVDVARQHGDFHRLDRGAGEAQLGRRRIVVVVDLEGDVEAAAAGVVAGCDRLQRAGVGGIQRMSPHVAVEGDG